MAGNFTARNAGSPSDREPPLTEAIRHRPGRRIQGRKGITPSRRALTQHLLDQFARIHRCNVDEAQEHLGVIDADKSGKGRPEGGLCIEALVGLLAFLQWAGVQAQQPIGRASAHQPGQQWHHPKPTPPAHGACGGQHQHHQPTVLVAAKAISTTPTTMRSTRSIPPTFDFMSSPMKDKRETNQLDNALRFQGAFISKRARPQNPLTPANTRPAPMKPDSA